jgi:predicted permease
MKIRRAIERLLALLRKRELDRELENEIAFHMESVERDALGRGLSPQEARREARLSFGGIEQVKQEHRAQRSTQWIETLLRDARYGMASLLRAPGFAAVVVGMLALGIGANVAMFSVVDAVLLKPLPFPEPERIVGIWEAPKPGVVNATSAPDFLDWKRLATGFEAMSAEQPISGTLNGNGEPIRLSGKAVTAEYFRVFAVNAQMGRTFTPEEDQPGAATVIVLSHAAWQDYFGRDPEILNRRVVLDGEAHQIIGVLPPGTLDRDETKFWKPLIFTPDQQLRAIHWLTVYGRLRGGVSLVQASDRMQAIHAALMELEPINDREGSIVVQPLARLLVGSDLRRSISVAFGVAALVLLIACANVTNLLLAKGATRRKKLAVRAALGASRGRLVGQLLTESLVLGLLGGAAGIAVAYVLIRVATPMLSHSLPFTAEVGLNLRMLSFSGAIALGVSLLVSMLPALRTSFVNVAASPNLSDCGSSDNHARIRHTIVMGSGCSVFSR